MNKKITLVTIFAFFIVVGGFAQTQPQHEKRTYVNPDGDLIVNRALPLYLHLSTSPDPNDPSHLLKSKATPEYTNPFYLDSEGVHYINHSWAVDTTTKKVVYPLRDIVFEVYADGLPPNTSINLYGAPRYARAGTTYYGKGLIAALTSRDAISGVENTYLSVNGNPYEIYSSDVKMDKEGSFSLKYFASDMVGNVEEPNKRDFVVDLTPPVTNHSTSQPKLNDILSPNATISLSMSDNLSGVKITRYGFDGSTRNTYQRGPIRLTALSDGYHTLHYFSTDNVDNAEQEKTYRFYLDRTPPEITFEIIGDIHKGPLTYVSPRTRIQLSATDNKAGVKEISYAIDGHDYRIYNTPFAIPDVLGRHTVRYFAEDKVENKNRPVILNVPASGPLFMDNRKPSTSIRYGNPQFFDRDTLFINENTNIYLTSRDQHSGVKVTHYKIDGGAEQTYSTPIKTSPEGFHTINFRAIDNVNNEETYKESNFFVDNTPPVIYTNFSIKPIGTRQKDGKTYDVYPNYTRLYVGATDKHVGTEKIRYSINGSPMVDYSSPYTLDISEVDRFREEKFYEVVIEAEDKLGNKSSVTIRFFVGYED